MARAKKKPADKLSDTLQVKMTKRDRTIINDAARASGLDTSTFVRVRILEMIGQINTPISRLKRTMPVGMELPLKKNQYGTVGELRKVTYRCKTV